MRITKILVLLFSIILVPLGCSNTNQILIQPDEVDRVTIRLVNLTESKDEYIYSFVLKNGTPYVIKQNTVYMGYRIEKGNMTKASGFLFPAQGNKLDIQPNEEVGLSVVVLKDELLHSPNLKQNEIVLELKGYFKEVKQENSFGKGGFIRVNPPEKRDSL